MGQFSILVEKLRKKRYSFNVTDMRRAILVFLFWFLFWYANLFTWFEFYAFNYEFYL